MCLSTTTPPDNWRILRVAYPLWNLPCGLAWNERVLDIHEYQYELLSEKFPRVISFHQQRTAYRCTLKGQIKSEYGYVPCKPKHRHQTIKSWAAGCKWSTICPTDDKRQHQTSFCFWLAVAAKTGCSFRAEACQCNNCTFENKALGSMSVHMHVCLSFLGHTMFCVSRPACIALLCSYKKNYV